MQNLKVFTVNFKGCKVGITSTPSPGQVAPVVGRRETGVSYLNRYKDALPGGDYCAKCCTGTNCNRDLCTSRQGEWVSHK